MIKITNKRIEDIVNSRGMFRLLLEEREELIDAIVSEKNAEWAVEILRVLTEPIPKENKALTPEEKEKLKKIILETDNPHTATDALISLG